MYFSIAGFAEHINRSKTRVVQLLKQGRITGVQRMGAGRWLIPDNAVIKPGKKRGRTKKGKNAR